MNKKTISFISVGCIILLLAAGCSMPGTRAAGKTAVGLSSRAAGSYNYGEALQKAIPEGIPIHWLGQLPPKELAERLSCARLVVIPSRLEGFSIAVLEALACGVPVVGWAPQIRELESTLGFPVGAAFDGRVQTAEELAGLILSVLRGSLVSPTHRLRLAKAARDAFSDDRYVDAYLSLYREMISPEEADPPR